MQLPRTFLSLGVMLGCTSSAFAAVAQSFQPPSTSPKSPSGNYTGQSNNTISNGPVVSGKVFDRFIQIWIENTDCESRLRSVDLTIDTPLHISVFECSHALPSLLIPPPKCLYPCPVATAASSPVFQNLSKNGVLLESFYAVTHPSEPNYLAAVAGDYWGLDSDDFCALPNCAEFTSWCSHRVLVHAPQNISTVVDLLEQANVSWASCECTAS